MIGKKKFLLPPMFVLAMAYRKSEKMSCSFSKFLCGIHKKVSMILLNFVHVTATRKCS